MISKTEVIHPEAKISQDNLQQAIPSFDLKRQNSLLQEEITAVLNEVIASGQFILGEHVKSVEEEIANLCGAKYGIGVGNGSDALYRALLVCGVGPGDEVITTPFTFFATAGSIVRRKQGDVLFAFPLPMQRQPLY